MIFDLVVLAALLISCLIAFLRGFIRETLTILGVIGGSFAAVSLGPKLSPLVLGWLGHKKDETAKGASDPHHHNKFLGLLSYDMLSDLIAYGAIFIIVVIVLSVFSHLLSGWAKKIGLGPVDRTFGVVFGVVRAIVLLALLYLPVYLLVKDEKTRDDWFKDSHTRVYVEATSAWLADMLPKSVSDDMNAAAQKASESMAGATRERLEKIDVLKGGDALKDKADELKKEMSTEDSSKTGQPAYESQQRDQMNTLIQQQTVPPGKPNE